MSPLQERRLQYKPAVPKILQTPKKLLRINAEASTCIGDEEILKTRFPNTYGQNFIKFAEGEAAECSPLKVGVVLSGGQAPGGHNVITAIYDALQSFHPDSLLYGFLNGPSGIVDGKYRQLEKQLIDSFRNQGGFHLIGSGRTKIETDEQLSSSLKVAKDLDLDGLVVIGGDDSNTNAAILAEYFQEHECKTVVIGVPKTIDGDLKNENIETSFGYDTACKVYSELIGNVMTDAFSAKKYYHFMKLMGRSASHITLECALKTKPNIALISEEVEEEKKTLSQVVSDVCDVIAERAARGKNFGIVLVPEGLIEFIPEVKALIAELNDLLSEIEADQVLSSLSDSSKACFESLPEKIQEQLLLDRDPHGNVQVSRIETEQLLIELVKKELKKRKKEGRYVGKFSAQHHFFGYEGRSGLPSNFDCNYCYALGITAATLIRFAVTGYIACVRNLAFSPDSWEPMGVPLTSMMQMEQRKGKMRPVIAKATVNLNDLPMQEFKSQRNDWAINERYISPGPIQFEGSPELCDKSLVTLELQSKSNAGV